MHKVGNLKHFYTTMHGQKKHQIVLNCLSSVRVPQNNVYVYVYKYIAT